VTLRYVTLVTNLLLHTTAMGIVSFPVSKPKVASVHTSTKNHLDSPFKVNQPCRSLHTIESLCTNSYWWSIR